MTVIMLGRHAFPQLSRVLQSVTRFTSTAAKITDLAGTASQTATPSVIAQQAPNYPTTWTTSQQPRPAVGSSPRFEQTAMEFQPNPLSAMELVSREPVRLVDGRRAVCDGGGGPLGHPKIYINLDQPGPRACGYCGIRFEQGSHHH